MSLVMPPFLQIQNKETMSVYLYVHKTMSNLHSSVLTVSINVFFFGSMNMVAYRVSCTSQVVHVEHCSGRILLLAAL